MICIGREIPKKRKFQKPRKELVHQNVESSSKFKKNGYGEKIFEYFKQEGRRKVSIQKEMEEKFGGERK